MMDDFTDINKSNVELMKARWTNRRWMTWLCLVAYVGFTAFIMASPPDVIPALMVPYTAFTTFVGGLIAFYFGLSTYDDTQNKDKYGTVGKPKS